MCLVEFIGIFVWSSSLAFLQAKFPILRSKSIRFRRHLASRNRFDSSRVSVCSVSLSLDVFHTESVVKFDTVSVSLGIRVGKISSEAVTSSLLVTGKFLGKF